MWSLSSLPWLWWLQRIASLRYCGFRYEASLHFKYSLESSFVSMHNAANYLKEKKKKKKRKEKNSKNKQKRCQKKLQQQLSILQSGKDQCWNQVSSIHINAKTKLQDIIFKHSLTSEALIKRVKATTGLEAYPHCLTAAL